MHLLPGWQVLALQTTTAKMLLTNIEDAHKRPCVCACSLALSSSHPFLLEEERCYRVDTQLAIVQPPLTAC
jgi:hypothetical protein